MSLPKKLALVFCVIVIGIFCRLSSLAASETPEFLAATPVWAEGRETEMNVTLGFRAVFDRPEREKVLLRMTGSTIYRVWVNGQFFAAGPARGPHGYYRVDELDLTDQLQAKSNVVAIEVVGYNSNSYYLLDQPSFLQAEIVATADGQQQVLAATGVAESGKAAMTNLMEATVLPERIQKVQRYSFQRPFTEAYELTPEVDNWKSDAAATIEPVTLAASPVKKLLPRHVLYPTYTIDRPTHVLSRGQFEPKPEPVEAYRDRAITGVGPKLKGYPEAELALCPMVEIQQYQSVVKDSFVKEAEEGKPCPAEHRIQLADKQWELITLGKNLTGFLGATIECKTPAEVWLLFDEIKKSPDDAEGIHPSQTRAVVYRLTPGTYRVETIEPYTMQYVKIACMKGDAEVSDVYLREYAHPEVDTDAYFRCSDERINRIYAAAVQTYRQNSLDIFMDCPSRERAGWLCDSFFTSRVETDLTGQNRIEKNFIENFLLPEKFECLPEGMLPMCYPSDHYDGVFIPNWAMWFVLELKQYRNRGGDPALVAKLEPKVMKLLDYFKPMENEDGLLEKLQGWVFVEWSAAANYVQDVNYPSNMLYAETLDVAGQLYKKPELCEKATELRKKIAEQSFDGEFFVDNALRQDGKLSVTRNRTEVCQYFAFCFGVATPESHPALWKRLTDEFGPNRTKQGLYPEVAKANSFIGNMLRMELLSQAGRNSQILNEQIDYLLNMADTTGTLWENDTPSASTNHGFASHAVHTYFRDVLGFYNVDRINRKVTVKLADLPLEFCEGQIPTPDGPIRLSWKKSGTTFDYDLKIPDGWTSEVIQADR